MPPLPLPKTSEQSSNPRMPNDTWDLYSLSNHYRPQSQTRPVIMPAQVSNLLIAYRRIFTRDNRPAGVFPIIRSVTGSSRHSNRSLTTAASQGGFLSGSQHTSRLQNATASDLRRFLRTSQRLDAMCARRRGSHTTVPPPKAVSQNRATTLPPQLNNNTVVVRMRQEPVPDEESETDESAGTQPYINLLDNPIGNAGSAAEEPVPEEEEDLTLRF